MWLLEFKAWNKDTEAEESLYYSDRGWISASGDSPAHTPYPARIKGGMSIERNVWASGRLGGSSLPSYGRIELENGDGDLDYLREYTFDGRAVELLYSADPDVARSSFTTKFKGTLRDGLVNERALVLELEDDKALEQPLTEKYRPYPAAYDFAGDATRAIETTITGVHSSSAFTLEFWFQSRYPQDNRMVTFGDTTATTTDDKLQIKSPIAAGGPAVVWDGTTFGGTGTHAQNFGDNLPHHLAVSYDGTTVRLYVDGLEWATSTESPLTAGSTPELILGAYKHSGSTYTNSFDGMLWGFRLWNTTRTAAQILENKDTELEALTESGLLISYPFSDLLSTDIGLPLYDSGFTPGNVSSGAILNHASGNYNGRVRTAGDYWVSMPDSAGDLEGQRKQLPIGPVFNMKPDLLDARVQRYAVADGPVDSISVREGGVTLRGQTAPTLDGASDYYSATAPASDDPDDWQIAYADGTAKAWEMSFNWDGFGAGETRHQLMHYSNSNVFFSVYLEGSAAASVANLYYTLIDANSNSGTVASWMRIDAGVNYRFTAVAYPYNDHMELIVNGLTQGTATPGFDSHTSPSAGATVAYWGRNTGGTAGYYFAGELWDIRCWNQVPQFRGRNRGMWRNRQHNHPFFAQWWWGGGINDDLVAWYPCDEGTGSTMRDFSRVKNSGTYTSIATWADPEWTDLHDGTFALNFAPTRPVTCDVRGRVVQKATHNNSNLRLSWAHDTEYEPEAGNFTVEFWANITEDNGSASQFMVSKKNAAVTATNAGWHAYFARVSAEKWQIRFGLSDGTSYETINGSDSFDQEDDGWNHYALTFNGTSRAYATYVNGVEYSSGTSTVANSITNAGYSLNLFTRSSSGSTNPFRGGLCEVRLWQAERTAKQIADGYLKTGSQLMKEAGAANLSFYWTGAQNTFGGDESYNMAPNSSVGGAVATTTNPAVSRRFGGPSFEWSPDHVKYLAIVKGETAYSDIDHATNETFDAGAGYGSWPPHSVAGWVYRDETVAEAIDKILAPTGTWYRDYNDNKLTIRKFEAPNVGSLISVATYSPSSEISISRLNAIKADEEASIRYQKNWAKLGLTDVLPTVKRGNTRRLTSDGPTAKKQSNEVSTHHLRPTEQVPVYEAPYRDYMGAKAAADTVIGNYGEGRERYEVEVFDRDFSLNIGDAVTLKDNRFNFDSAGEQFVIVGIIEMSQEFRYKLEVWG